MDKKLGRWHRWWLKRLNNDSSGLAIMGYEGTVQGKALITLLKLGLIERSDNFGGFIDIIMITEKGKKELKD